MSMDLRENFHIFCSVIVYPVVPKDVIMFRIIPYGGPHNGRCGGDDDGLFCPKTQA